VVAHGWARLLAQLLVRVRVEIMGSQKCGIVEKSQSALIMINPVIFTRTRNHSVAQLSVGE
jgi:hypothetical protein